MTSPIDARAEYRKRIQQRQTVIFGTICGVLALLLILGLLTWTGLLPTPFNRAFSEQSEEEAALVPCPVEGANPADVNTMTVRVYNSTSLAGVAGQVGTSLAELGVTVSETANWGGEVLPESVRIYAGDKGITSAYTLRAYFPGATIHFDPSNNSEILDVVIGEQWTEIHTAPTPEDIQDALEPIEGCSPVS